VARTAGPVFLPVAVAATITSGETPARDAAPDKTSPSTPSEAACCSADSRIEIELENGRRVRFGAGVDTEALKRILDLVDRR
jgi:transposase